MTDMIFDSLFEIIQNRKAFPKENSYVAKLFKQGQDALLKKIAEESGELLLASKNHDTKEILHETADLWFHSLLVLAYHGLSPEDVYQELAKRNKKTN